MTQQEIQSDASTPEKDAAMAAMVDGHLVPMATLYTNRMEPLIKADYRIHMRRFEEICPDIMAKAYAFHLCERSGVMAQPEAASHEDTRADKRTHDTQRDCLTREMGCTQQQAESIILLYRLTFAAKKLETAVKHLPKGKRTLAHALAMPSAQFLSEELMQKAGFQQIYDRIEGGIADDQHEKHINRSAKRCVDAVMEDFVSSMIEHLQTEANIPQWIKRKRPDLQQLTKQVGAYDAMLLHSPVTEPLWREMTKLCERNCERLKIPKADSADILDKAVGLVSACWDNAKNKSTGAYPRPIPITDITDALSANGFDKYFEGGETEQRSAVNSIRMLGKLKSLMDGYVSAGFSACYAPPVARPNARKDQQGFARQLWEVLEYARTSLPHAEIPPAKVASEVRDAWCSKVDADIANLIPQRAAGRSF